MRRLSVCGGEYDNGGKGGGKKGEMKCDETSKFQNSEFVFFIIAEFSFLSFFVDSHFAIIIPLIQFSLSRLMMNSVLFVRHCRKIHGHNNRQQEINCLRWRYKRTKKRFAIKINKKFFFCNREKCNQEKKQDEKAKKLNEGKKLQISYFFSWQSPSSSDFDSPLRRGRLTRVRVKNARENRL